MTSATSWRSSPLKATPIHQSTPIAPVCLPPIQAFKVGNHPTVRRLMRGIFNSRPPTEPRPPVWDVAQLLQFMDAWGPSSELSAGQAACRTLPLLLITSAARMGEIADLVYPLSLVSRTNGNLRWATACPRLAGRDTTPLLWFSRHSRLTPSGVPSPR